MRVYLGSTFLLRCNTSMEFVNSLLQGMHHSTFTPSPDKYTCLNNLSIACRISSMSPWPNVFTAMFPDRQSAIPHRNMPHDMESVCLGIWFEAMYSSCQTSPASNPSCCHSCRKKSIPPITTQGMLLSIEAHTCDYSHVRRWCVMSRIIHPANPSSFHIQCILTYGGDNGGWSCV